MNQQCQTRGPGSTEKDRIPSFSANRPGSLAGEGPAKLGADINRRGRMANDGAILETSTAHAEVFVRGELVKPRLAAAIPAEPSGLDNVFDGVGVAEDSDAMAVGLDSKAGGGKAGDHAIGAAGGFDGGFEFVVVHESTMPQSVEVVNRKRKFFVLFC